MEARHKSHSLFLLADWICVSPRGLEKILRYRNNSFIHYHQPGTLFGSCTTCVEVKCFLRRKRSTFWEIHLYDFLQRVR